VTDDAGLPSTEDVLFFEEHGWWTSPVIIPEEVLERASLGAERHYAGERDQDLIIGGGFLDWRPEHGDVVRLNDYVSMQNDDLRELVELPVLAQCAAMLARTDAVRLFHDQLICKPPGLAQDSSSVGWHVDAAYWRTCSSKRMLTAWVPFQDCDEEMGALNYVDGSHTRLDTDWMRTFSEQDGRALERSISPGDGAIPKVGGSIRRGQVAFHHSRTIHGSSPNRTGRGRLALAIHYQDRDNGYVDALDANGRPVVHINDLLCRKTDGGKPDYSDPAICPQLWPTKEVPTP